MSGIRMSVKSDDGNVDLFAMRSTVPATEETPEHDVITLSHKNGKGGEKTVGAFDADTLKALHKAL